MRCMTWQHILSVSLRVKGHWATAGGTIIKLWGSLSDFDRTPTVFTSCFSNSSPQKLKPPTGDVYWVILALRVGSLFVTLPSMINALYRILLL